MESANLICPVISHEIKKVSRVAKKRQVIPFKMLLYLFSTIIYFVCLLLFKFYNQCPIVIGINSNPINPIIKMGNNLSIILFGFIIY